MEEQSIPKSDLLYRVADEPLIASSDLLCRILQAARVLFVRQGYNNTSLKQISRAAGTSDTGVLRVVDSKPMLLRMVCGLCWLDTNKAFDGLVETALHVNPDPRFVTVAAIGGSLDRYETGKEQSHFMISHFPTLEPEEEPEHLRADPYIAWLLDQYNQYMARLDRLADAIVDDSNRFTASDVSQGVLREWMAVMRYGMLMSWYQLDRGLSKNTKRVSVEEAVDLMILLLYGDIDKHKKETVKNQVATVRDQSMLSAGALVDTSEPTRS